MDIAGLVKGASKGEGLGNKFLSHIREVDAIVHVVRCFEDENVIHVDGSVDPRAGHRGRSDLELIFADMETVPEAGRPRPQKLIKTGEKSIAEDELDAAEALLKHLEAGQPARTLPADEEEKATAVRNWFLLTDKPVIYAANIAEDDLAKHDRRAAAGANGREIAKKEGAEVFVISARIEEEIGADGRRPRKAGVSRGAGHRQERPRPAGPR